MLRNILSGVLLLLCPFSSQVYAQGENNNWTFGDHFGLKFNTSPPSFFQNSNVSCGASASVSNASGSLLFYSNGNDVWDATGTIMPNGSGILGNEWHPDIIGGPGYPASSSQGVYIVQTVHNSHQYYLFTLESSVMHDGITHNGALRYSVIDMTLNAGHGDVVAGQKNIVADTGIVESMVVARGDGCYYWLITQRKNTSFYRAYKIDVAGIHPPVISPSIIPAFYLPGLTGAGAGSAGGYSYITLSPDGHRLANCNLGFPGVELSVFDNATGIISNGIIIDQDFTALGACFSPDNTKLYTASFPGLIQFELASFPSASAIQSTRLTIDSSNYFFGMRAGPDGKVYARCASSGIASLGTVHNPNAAGITCNYSSMAIPLPGTSNARLGSSLGNNAATGASIDTFFHETDTLICSGNTYEVNAQPGCDNYLWNDGATVRYRTLTDDGTYWVYGLKGCHVELDTFRVHFEHLGVDLGSDTFMCPGGNLMLDATQPGATYQWQDNSTDATYLVNHPGLYFVTVSRNGCQLSDSVSIREVDPNPAILEGDTTICTGKSIILHAYSELSGTTVWDNGVVLPELTVQKPGTYTVRTTNNCGAYAASATVSMEPCNCIPFIPNVFSPNGDGLNDLFLIKVNCHATQFIMRIFNRYGERIYENYNPEQGWDGSYKGQAASSDTYFYQVQYYGPEGQFINKKGDITLVR